MNSAAVFNNKQQVSDGSFVFLDRHKILFRLWPQTISVRSRVSAGANNKAPKISYIRTRDISSHQPWWIILRYHHFKHTLIHWFMYLC